MESEDQLERRPGRRPVWGSGVWACPGPCSLMSVFSSVKWDLQCHLLWRGTRRPRPRGYWEKFSISNNRASDKITRKQSVRGTTVEIRYNTRFEILVPTFFYTLFCYSLEVKPDEYRHGYIRLNIYVPVNNLLGIFRVRQCALCSTTFLTYFQNTPMK